jgi:SAM-dependent methyltransferase
MLPLGLSYRRALLDAELGRLAGGLEGVVLEIGAKRVVRGRWVAPRAQVRRWIRLNLAPEERPDVVADAQLLPLDDASVDWVVCVEVLQYLVAPEVAMREIARVLVPGGRAVIAVPFLHRADGPTDRHRFTEVSLVELIGCSGLRLISLTAQARFFGTLANHLRQAVANIRSRPVRWLTAAATMPLAALLLALDGLGPVRRSPFLASYATGFAALARKG